MDYMHEIHNTRERIKQLEIENAKLVTECDTLRQGRLFFLYSNSTLFIGMSSTNVKMPTP